MAGHEAPNNLGLHLGEDGAQGDGLTDVWCCSSSCSVHLPKELVNKRGNLMQTSSEAQIALVRCGVFCFQIELT